MSQKWRNKNRPTQAATATTLAPQRDNDVTEGYVTYDPTFQAYADFIGGNSPQIEAEADFPGQREYFHPEAAEYNPTFTQPQMAAPGNETFNLIDREIGGQRGFVDDQPYSTGVVSSDLVENYWLDGTQAVIRRGRNPSDEGAVGTSDYSGSLALRFAQATSQYFPNEASQSDLVKSI